MLLNTGEIIELDLADGYFKSQEHHDFEMVYNLKGEGFPSPKTVSQDFLLQGRVLRAQSPDPDFIKLIKKCESFDLTAFDVTVHECRWTGIETGLSGTFSIHGSCRYGYSYTNLD
jgi:hypothetical protein